MAAKKAPQQGAQSADKKSPSTGGKKDSSATGKKVAPVGKKSTPAVAKKGAAALAATKHDRMRIGLKKKSKPPRVFQTRHDNTFMVYGDSIGTTNPNNKEVHLDATHHTWVNPPTRVRNQGPDALEITARCDVKIMSRKGFDTDDDLTVTITLDGGTSTPDTTDCHFDDVQYDA